MLKLSFTLVNAYINSDHLCVVIIVNTIYSYDYTNQQTFISFHPSLNYLSCPVDGCSHYMDCMHFRTRARSAHISHWLNILIQNNSLALSLSFSILIQYFFLLKKLTLKSSD